MTPNGTRATPKKITSHRDLEVWQRAFALSMKLFRASKSFPREEAYSLTSQVRRSSRSVTTSITEAWRKRRYEGAFVAKLSDAETEAAETQDWLHYAVECGYLDRAEGRHMYAEYERIVRTLVGIIAHADKWTFPRTPSAARQRAGS